MLYDTILTKSTELDTKIHSLKKQLTHLPPGDFFCSRNSGRYKWFHTDHGKQTYIPKKDHLLAEQMALKKYLTLQLQELEREKQAIDFYLRHHDTSPSPSGQLLKHPEYQKLLEPYFLSSDEIAVWANTAYPKNPLYPEHLIHKTISGNLVRSKSETLIDMVLYQNKIPFRYECALQLGEITIYPDFTIMHPITGKLFYWEHFGRMDEPEYLQKTQFKLNSYIHHGIIPSVQLITTFETKNHPLDPELVESLVKHYFL
ncbi:MAG: ATPase [Lachnospiraceae bacterium]|nr:ATPase [Lachnospiraceae bacterium]